MAIADFLHRMAVAQWSCQGFTTVNPSISAKSLVLRDQMQISGQGNRGNLGIFCADGQTSSLALRTNERAVPGRSGIKVEAAPCHIGFKKCGRCVGQGVAAFAFGQKGNTAQDFCLRDAADEC